MSKRNNALRFQLEKYCVELNTLFPELEAHVSNATDIAQIKIRGKK
jgi:hypothetical protein